MNSHSPSAKDVRPSPLVIAIDGPAGAGKSTVARALAERLDLEVLDTGAMYRTIALAALKVGCDLGDVEALGSIAAQAQFTIGPPTLLDGQDVTVEIRSAAVTAAASSVAACGEVRNALVSAQRKWVAERSGGVVEGRDIATVVFPDATLKIFLIADVQERANRRSLEINDKTITDSDMALAISLRDERDTQRAISPLLRANDAHEIDTTNRDVGSIVHEVLELLTSERERRSDE